MESVTHVSGTICHLCLGPLTEIYRFLPCSLLPSGAIRSSPTGRALTRRETLNASAAAPLKKLVRAARGLAGPRDLCGEQHHGKLVPNTPRARKTRLNFENLYDALALSLGSPDISDVADTKKRHKPKKSISPDDGRRKRATGCTKQFNCGMLPELHRVIVQVVASRGTSIVVMRLGWYLSSLRSSSLSSN